MSNLQRSIQQNSRSASRVRSSASSRSSSRLGSRVQSDDEDDYTSNAFLTNASLDTEELTDSLDGLTVKEGATQSKDRFTKSLEMLGTHERKTSLEAREKALHALVGFLTVKYDPDRVDEYALEQIGRAFKSARSDTERTLSLHAICLSAATDPEAADDLTKAILPRLFEKISDEEVSLNVRANYAFGYSMLQFIMLQGSGAYGAENTVVNLVEVADGLGQEESMVASACILGAGLVASTMPNVNAAADDCMTYLVDMLDSPSHDVKLSAGKVIAMFYQLYDYEEEDGEIDTIPVVDHEDVTYKLHQLVGESSKKLGKRDKREQKSLFRDVVKTVNAFSSAESREQITEDDITITHVKLTRSKDTPIDSWSKLILVQMYKWLFGPGLHAHVSTNPMLQETLDDASLRFNEPQTDDEFNNYEPTRKQTSYFKKMKHNKDDLSRNRDIRKQREEKIQLQMDEVDH